jgi:hypothetical protein
MTLADNIRIHLNCGGLMLTRLIVVSYAWMVEAALWVAVVVAAVVGYQITLPVMSSFGVTPTSELTWQILGALLLPLFTLLVLAIVAGPLLLLVDIRQSLRSLEARMTRGKVPRGPALSERREPSI